ncbi:MAG TPA: hypothetical protein VL283_03800 [Candidatus Baltobacteraceae bacterium]|nr:hypothetical protein [Candidatus Baltobacteraceae bacterium]
MSKLWRGILAIHDTSGFGHLGEHIPGVEFYADRALLTPVDVAVIQSDGFDDYLCWLRSVGIGPNQIICVDDVNLFRGLTDGAAKVSEFSRGLDGRLQVHWTDEPQPIKRLQQFASRGGKIQVFCMTEEAEAFFQSACIDRKRIQSAPLESARRMNDKAELRRVAERAGVPQAFLPHAATNDPSRVMTEVFRFLAMPKSQAEFVVLKRTNLAGGDGFLKIPRGLAEEDVKARVIEYLRENHWNDLTLVTHCERAEAPDAAHPMDRAAVRDFDKACEAVSAAFEADPRVTNVTVTRTDVVGGASVRFRRGGNFRDDLRSYLGQHGRNEIIVEAGFAHWAYSNLAVIRGKDIRILGPTRQIVDEETGTHLGNMMLCKAEPEAFPQHLTGHPNDVLEREDIVTMDLFSRRLAEEAHVRDEGYEDFLGFDYMMRASDGDVFMLECNARLTASAYPLALAAQLKGRNWGIVMLNGIPTSARNFGELRGKLGDRLFRPEDGGLLPFNIRLMTLEDPRCGMIAVAPSLPEALALMEEAKALSA